ncbi:trna delta -isopentenylpyrophosphate transferase [Methylobacterium sp. WL30]|uniref:trna delta -isopentenylpyrophosphate transferase n=1 Tax=unclassified Methylobacterium TaxID=2615210 RepID=UPI0011CAE2C9|nr:MULTISPECIES: trna delta -isopentenylpyrophosphate transferase [unclassified Methylobacterium]TXM94703.1 trna delta -isopentenylpyrophosphate transferase [Methylobacterium sp. WL116]TXN40806.1 trna delta -isopentenylpyrophosphate transferase [Methylobacterium sp. WL93]TXN50738.1 trna delta -isopentenylpyrophosphate transferase [Methylobacterium sp. WL119]TXN67843.1 trna delta -isopentenylpyrophosphate transferase [Methylobacterium sp. WL30]
MRTADKQIADILVRYGEPFGGNVWRVQGTAVIYHRTLERIAAQAGIRFDPPTLLRAERDEAVILVTGRLPGVKPGSERVEWSIGEALVNVNYRVSGKQAGYVYAMAEKRAKDRVILKLLELHGLVYSEEEADEFRHGHPAAVRDVNEDLDNPDPFDEVTEAEADLKRRIDEMTSIDAVTDLMLDTETQRTLGQMPSGTRDEVRDYAKARLVALGWPPKKSRRTAA